MTNRANVNDLFQQAIEMDKAGQSAAAARHYHAILEIEPGHAYARYLLGVQALHQGQHEEAIGLIRGAIAHQPREATFHHFLGQALQAGGDAEQAIVAYRKALDIAPQHAAAQFRCGTALRSVHRLEEAVQALRVACQENPSMSAACIQLGEVLQELGRHEEALNCYNQLLDSNPQLVAAYMRKGEILLSLNRFDEAQQNYRRLFVLQRGPGMNDAVFRQHTESPPGADVQPVQVLPFFIENLSEHIDHLLANNMLDISFTQAGKLLDALPDEMSANSNELLTLSPEQATSIRDFYDRALHVTDTTALAGDVINTSLDFQEIESTYLSAGLPMVHFDSFLTPEALQTLYEFCLDATIFHRQSHNGFLSSYVYEGFNCALLYRIVAELKQQFPRILGALELRNMWVYRYPCHGDGVRPHSDQAAVTVNFWITPDSANLDKEHGGLVIYDRKQPMDWDWYKTNQYKDSPEMLKKIETYLQGANTVTVPYRENRALMFHSNLFHASDCFTFKAGYRNRRMNVTLLFGDRA